MKYISNSLEQTNEIAKNIMSSIIPPKTIVLSGDLGAGKTTLTKGIARFLGITREITSPTFTIMNDYIGICPLYHFDMYRINDISELTELGLYDYLYDSTAICVIEWAENVPQILPQSYIEIKIEKIDDNSRSFEVFEKN